MATLLDLARRGVVEKLEAELRPRQQELRAIYAFPKAVTKIESVIAGLESHFESEISPLEQLDAFAGIYCSGEPLMFERQFQPLWHIGAAVWELKTRDLRLFGWFYRRDVFVCTNIDDATRVKKFSLYAGYRDEAVRDRDSIDLDEPKYVPGDNPSDVISNFTYPPPPGGR